MNYEAVIGLEVHAELSTKTKIYCGCTAEFGGEQNTHCCPVCLGLPGALPVLNKRVVDYAIKAGLALNCSISKESHMARKNYFYPDCPKNYQITQEETPLCRNGHIDINMENGLKRVTIHRIHIEEDAGKAIHNDDGTRLDFNRAGVPLIEIVSDPDIHSPKEARDCLEKLKAILQYIEISDCKMEEGSLRCDANISIRLLGSNELGTKTEIKNMNSLKALEKALSYEIKRHVNAAEKGEKITQETRRWDEEKGETIVMRSKEEAHDYRYFQEPDMVYLRVDKKWIERISKSIPELPDAKKKRYLDEYGLPEYDADVLTSSNALSVFFDECMKNGGNPKDISNWIMGEVLRALKEKGIGVEDIKFKPLDLVKLVKLIDNGTISGTIAKRVFNDMFKTGETPENIVSENELAQVSDEGAIREIVRKILDENPKSVDDFKNGKSKALGFLVGQIMKVSGGKTNPQIASRLLNEELNRS